MVTQRSKSSPLVTNDKSRPTLVDVAAYAGVSPITVSRALSHPEKVSEKLRAKVAKAVKSLGYIPDASARALASGKSPAIVTLIPSLANSVFVDVLESIHSVLEDANYQMLIGNTYYRADEEERLLRAYLANQPSGLLLAGFERTAACERLIVECGLPVVYMMETSNKRHVHSVGIDQQGAGYALMAALLSRGFKRIGLIAAQLDRRTLMRVEGYRASLRAAKVWSAKREILTSTPSSSALGAQLLDQLLTQAPDTDCVFFCNDDLAIGGLRRAHERGLFVPQQLGITGFNDLAQAQWVTPTLTTVNTPRAEVGRRAATMLLKLIRGEPIAVRNETLPFTLCLRESA